ncbi:unnamed protein product [Closterium sp. NIES-53]
MPTGEGVWGAEEPDETTWGETPVARDRRLLTEAEQRIADMEVLDSGHLVGVEPGPAASDQESGELVLEPGEYIDVEVKIPPPNLTRIIPPGHKATAETWHPLQSTLNNTIKAAYGRGHAAPPETAETASLPSAPGSPATTPAAPPAPVPPTALAPTAPTPAAPPAPTAPVPPVRAPPGPAAPAPQAAPTPARPPIAPGPPGSAPPGSATSDSATTGSAPLGPAPAGSAPLGPAPVGPAPAGSAPLAVRCTGANGEMAGAREAGEQGGVAGGGVGTHQPANPTLPTSSTPSPTTMDLMKAFSI